MSVQILVFIPNVLHFILNRPVFIFLYDNKGLWYNKLKGRGNPFYLCMDRFNNFKMKHDNSLALDPKIIDFIVNDRYRLLRHLLLYVSFFIVILSSNWLNDYSGIYKAFRLTYVMVVFLALFYVNMYLLVPYLFFKGRYISYIVVLILFVKGGIELTSYLITTYPTFLVDAKNVVNDNSYTGAVEGTVISVPIILITTTIKLFQRWAKDNQSIAEIKNLALTMELKELRNQINPHFLFNMLNGIKALVRKDPDKATAVIMKLSEFLRYQLYENDERNALLGTEIKFLSNFLSLETLRRDNLETSITYKSPESSLNSVLLPPNLFTTFVENAVKHSVTVDEDKSSIHIEFGIEDNKLCFCCKNSKDPSYIPSQKNSGLGLANIKRRLELLYGENYNLDIDDTPTEYLVKLKLKI